MVALLVPEGERPGWRNGAASSLERGRSEEWFSVPLGLNEGSYGLWIRGESRGRCACRLPLILALPVLAFSTIFKGQRSLFVDLECRSVCAS